MSDNKNKISKTGLVVMVCNIVIMISNYIINLVQSNSNEIALIVNSVVEKVV